MSAVLPGWSAAAALHQRGKADVARRRRSSGGISVAKPEEEFYNFPMLRSVHTHGF